MLVGEYSHSLDTKSRLIMPLKLREELGDKFYISKGLDGCLYGFSNTEWEQFARKLNALPGLKKEEREFKRFFFSGACECETDKQGRILIPQSLREYAGLDKEALIIGVCDRVEIWSKERREGLAEESSFDPEGYAEKMADLGIW